MEANKRLLGEDTDSALKGEMKNPTEGEIIKKTWKKKNGEYITKYFIVFENKIVKGFGECGPPDSPGFDECVSRKEKNYIMLCDDVPDHFKPRFTSVYTELNIKIVFDLQQNSTTKIDPRGECIPLKDIVYVNKEDYVAPIESEPEIEDEIDNGHEDEWWNNEITDEMEIKYGDKIGKAIDGHCWAKSFSYHEPSNTCVYFMDSKKFDEWWNSRNN